MRCHVRSLALFAAAATAIAACGGSATEGVTPPPPPPVVPHVASLTYATPSALIFTGHTVPAEALVQAFDAQGNALSDTLLDFTLPAGWVLKHDSITAPTWESEGALSAAPKAQYAADVAFATAPAGGSQVVGAINLRGYNWHVSWSCADTQPLDTHTGNRQGTGDSVYIDSIHFVNFRADSVFYTSDTLPGGGGGGIAYVHNWGGVAQIALATDSTYQGVSAALWFYRDGVVDTVTGGGPVIVVDRQAPDSIVTTPGNPIPLIRGAGADSLQWFGSGRSLCGPAYMWQVASPVTANAIPKG